MLKNIIQRHPVEIEERSIDFTNEEGAGFCFDCDENGTPKFACEAARLNYMYAMEHPELYPTEYNVVKRWKRTIIEPAHGTCSCGETVYLTDEYMGRVSVENAEDGTICTVKNLYHQNTGMSKIIE